MTILFPAEERTEKKELQGSVPGLHRSLYQHIATLAQDGYNQNQVPLSAWPQTHLIKKVYLQAKQKGESWKHFRKFCAGRLWDRFQTESPSWHVHPCLLLEGKTPLAEAEETLLDNLIKNLARRLYLRLYLEKCPSGQKEIIHKKILEPKNIQGELRQPRQQTPNHVRLALKTRLAWHSFVASQKKTRRNSNPLTLKPEHCIPLAAHLTEAFWKVSQTTAHLGKSLGNPWFLFGFQRGYQVPELARCAIQLAMAETFTPIGENKFQDPTTNTIVCSENNKEGKSTYTPSNGEINIHCSVILQAAGTADHPHLQAKAYLANYVFHEVCHGFQSKKERKPPPPPPGVREEFLKNLEAQEIFSNAMGVAAEQYYSRTGHLSHPQIYPLSDPHEYLITAKYASESTTFPRGFQKYCRTAYRSFRLLHKYYLKKIEEFLE